MRSITSVRNVFLHPIPASRKYGSNFQSSLSPNMKEWKEFEVQMPWGVVAAKWWGRQDVRPIVAIHGWLDNAGTFDRLIPLLPDHVGYLAIDLPGHGRSSHFPPGMYYSTLDFVRSIETMRLQMKWDRLSLIAHSMGSQLAFTYASLKPDLVDMLVGIDVLKPVVRKHSRIIFDYIKQIDDMTTENARKMSKLEPPSYTNDELISRVVKGSMGSVSAEFAHHLIERSVAPSAIHANKYFFQRDSRIKFMSYAFGYHELTLEMARRIEAPHLFIKANQAKLYEDEVYFNEVTDEMKRTNPSFETIRIDGGHHIHLMQPENVSGPISKFINKYRSGNANKIL